MDGRGLSATTIKERFDRTVLLADANMKAALEVNDLESSEEGVGDQGTKNDKKTAGEYHFLPAPHRWSKLELPFVARTEFTYHCSFVHLSFAGQSRLHLLSRLHEEDEEHILEARTD